MKFIYLLLIFATLLGCKSVDNWVENPVLSLETIELAGQYVDSQTHYLTLIDKRDTLDIKENQSIEKLDNILKIERNITLSSRDVLNSWFDFYLQLRQDRGFIEAYKGHYYFRRAIDTLEYSEKMKKSKNIDSVKENKSISRINELEVLCRLSIGQIVSDNNTLYSPDEYYKELKKLYKSMD